MKRRLTSHLVLIAALAAILAVLTDAWARQKSVFEQLDLLVDVRHELVDSYVENPDQEQMVRSAVRGMIEALEDPYTTYLPPEAFESLGQTITGQYSGIGAEVDLSEGRLRIVTPLEDSPAWNAGVTAGDIVLEINGESTEGLSLPEAVEKLTGERGTDVTILVRHESGEEEEITITRDTISVQSVRGFRRDGDQNYDFMLDDEQRIAYVRMTQFTERTVEELRRVLEQLKQGQAQALILDLRFNPGGLLDSAVSVADLFLDEGAQVVSVKGRTVPERVYQAQDGTLLPDLPVVVLANEASASAAEIVTGALKDNDRALFVGTRTFGKGSVQEIKRLNTGGALKLTTAYYYIPSGRLIHRREDSERWGVDPSEGSYVAMSPEQVNEMLEVRRENELIRPGNGEEGEDQVTPGWIRERLKDPQLAAALEAVQGRLASGDWPTVGSDNVEALVQAGERHRLVMQRDLLRERLEEVSRELNEIDGQAVAEADPEEADADETTDDATASDEEQVEVAEEAPATQPSP